MADPQILQDFTPVLKNVYLPIRKKIFPINTVLLAQARKLGPEHVTYAGNDLFFDSGTSHRRNAAKIALRHQVVIGSSTLSEAFLKSSHLSSVTQSWISFFSFLSLLGIIS